MFETKLEMDQEGITVPYAPLFDEIRKNYGFVDTRCRPDLAAQVAETSQSPAMKTLLIQLAHPNSKIFSVGCDLGEKFLPQEETPYVAGGYVQVMHVEYGRCMPEDYARLAEPVAIALEKQSDGHNWQMPFVLMPVAFKLDGFDQMTCSLWIWFHAFAESRETALRSRESLIQALEDALTDERNLAMFDDLQESGN